MVGHRLFHPIDELLKIVFKLDIQSMGQSGDTRVITVVTLQAMRKAPCMTTVEEEKPFADVRIGMPAINHALVKAVNFKKRLARDKLKVARGVEAHIGMRKGY